MSPIRSITLRLSLQRQIRINKKSLLVLSSKGKFMRFDIEDGSMIWETIAYTEAAASEELYIGVNERRRYRYLAFRQGCRWR